MSAKKRIPPLVQARIFTMYRQGYSYRLIGKETGYTDTLVRARIKAAGIKRDIPLPKIPNQIDKYDYVYTEPVAQGKFYNEYLKNDKKNRKNWTSNTAKITPRTNN